MNKNKKRANNQVQKSVKNSNKVVKKNSSSIKNKKINKTTLKNKKAKSKRQNKNIFKKFLNFFKKKNKIKIKSTKRKNNINQAKKIRNTKNKYIKKIYNIFKKKKNTQKKSKKINIKEKINNFWFFINKKIDVKKRNKLTKEMYIFIFIIIELFLFNFALFISRIIPFEYYNSIEFLAIVFMNPFILIIEGLIYGTKFGFSYIVPILLALIFILSVLVFLKIGFLFYLPIYFIFALSSEICGITLNKVKRI